MISFHKWAWRSLEGLRMQSSSSFFKLPSVFEQKLNVPQKSKPAQSRTPGTSEYYVPQKFVPITRKALIRRIVEDENLVKTQDRHYFQDLAGIVDKKIAGSFHGILGELKV